MIDLATDNQILGICATVALVIILLLAKEPKRDDVPNLRRGGRAGRDQGHLRAALLRAVRWLRRKKTSPTGTHGGNE